VQTLDAVDGVTARAGNVQGRQIQYGVNLDRNLLNHVLEKTNKKQSAN
jgi:hypothetical protein